MFRFLFSLFLVLSLSANAQAQVGISAHYLSGQADKWEFTFPDTRQPNISLPGEGWQLGIDYWFRLKNLRIEFLPTLAISNQQQDLLIGSSTLNTELRAYHIFFNTNFYLFDFKGDCDCPTFSKEGPSLQKGVFLQLSPGYSSFNYSINDEELQAKLESNNSQFSIGVALGFDLGLSDLLTITPQLGVRYYPSVEWETLALNDVYGFPESISPKSSLLQYAAGIRLGFRFE
jgi:hypothetical protein